MLEGDFFDNVKNCSQMWLMQLL